MASLNKWTGIGYLGKDPDVQFLPSGMQTAKFSIACQESWTDKGGEKKEHTEWVNIVSFGRIAEIISEYLKKGSMVYIEGKLRTRSWEDKEGNKKYITEIVVNNLQMLDRKKDGGKSEHDRSMDEHNSPVDDDVPF